MLYRCEINYLLDSQRSVGLLTAGDFGRAEID
jgi:hypothetical protein